MTMDSVEKSLVLQLVKREYARLRKKQPGCALTTNVTQLQPNRLRVDVICTPPIDHLNLQLVVRGVSE